MGVAIEQIARKLTSICCACAPQEGISTIITAISRSRMIFRRLETYIIYRIASSLLILGFFFFAIVILEFEIPTWVLVRPPCRSCRVTNAAHPILIRRTAHVHQAWQACGVACFSKCVASHAVSSR